MSDRFHLFKRHATRRRSRKCAVIGPVIVTFPVATGVFTLTGLVAVFPIAQPSGAIAFGTVGRAATFNIALTGTARPFATAGSAGSFPVLFSVAAGALTAGG